MAKRYMHSMKRSGKSQPGPEYAMNDGFKDRSSLDMEDYVSGLRARDRMEAQKDGMIREDHRAIANLPQEVMIKPYEQVGPYLPEGIDDTIKGADRQMDDNDEQRSRYFSPKK